MSKLKQKLYRIIFFVDTFWGKVFDIFLLFLIFASVFLVALESVESLNNDYASFFYVSEWVITLFFTVEYILRIIVSRNTYKYVVSFWGIIDLLSILPSYLAIFFSGAHVLAVIRALRLIRVFRVFNLSAFENEGKLLVLSIKRSLRKIGIFLYTVTVLVTIIGTIMYFVEGAEHGFSSIPKSIYWAIVTLTTVGYGDISPQTSLGQFFASIIMITGYAIIAVPTGIVSAEMVRTKSQAKVRKCPNCKAEINDKDAVFCKFCGQKLSSD
jgi:voltage-gated potassium channel